MDAIGLGHWTEAAHNDRHIRHTPRRAQHVNLDTSVVPMEPDGP